MFSDRHLRLKGAVTLALLWGSGVWARWRASELYPPFAVCAREPERHAGRVLAVRAMPVAASQEGRTTVLDREGGPVPLFGIGDAAWAGRHLSAVGRFVPPAGERPAGIEILRGPDGKPRARIEEDFPVRRRWMYAVSILSVLGWALLFRRAFSVDPPRGLIGKRGIP